MNRAMETRPRALSLAARRRGFIALSVSQFLGAFNDNAFKMLILALAADSAESDWLLAVTGILMMLPAVLFSLPAGAISDRFSKQRVLIWTKLLEVAAMGIATLAFAAGHREAVLGLFFLMALQAALYGPSKFGILPDLLTEEELSMGNGIIELLTFVAVILGLSAPPFLRQVCGGSTVGACGILAGLAVAGMLATLLVPRVEPADPGRRLSFNPLVGLGKYRRILREDLPLRLTVMGTVFYWSVALFLAQACLLHAKHVLLLDEKMQTLPYVALAVGIGVGSGLAGYLSNRQVELGLVPLGALGMVVFNLIIALLGRAGLAWVLPSFALLGASGGFFIVPLNAFLQQRSPLTDKGGVVAVGNFFQSLGMLIAAGLFLVLTKLHVPAPVLFLLGSLITLAVAVYLFRLLPEALVRFVLWCLSRVFYRIRVVGRDNIPSRGPCLLICNHVSFVDGLFILASTHRFVRFVMDKGMSGLPFMRWVFKALRVIPISTSEGPKVLLRALRTASAALGDGRAVAIFAEGEITRTGQMLPFKRGFERILKTAPPGTPIIPVHLDRVWGSIFSFSGRRFLWKRPRRFPYPVTVSIGKPLPSGTPLFAVRQAVEELGTEAFVWRKRDQEPLHRAFARTARRLGSRPAAADSTGAQWSYASLLVRSVLLARLLRLRFADQEMVGLLLPPSAAAAAANIAVLLSGRVPVNLNYTASAESIRRAAEQCRLTTVITSRAFLDRVKVEVPGKPVFLEDLTAASAPLGERIGGWLSAYLLPLPLLEKYAGRRRKVSVDDLATVIFSSGSTGDPKGVMLTHANILSNLEGLAQLYEPQPSDAVLGVLPFFHSFGFTATIWFPLVQGLRVVYHSNPMDAREVGRMAREHGVTFLLSTPTFLQVYTRRCEPGDFGSLKNVIVGAEKLSARVAEAFEERFGIQPLEGYGCTECSPLVAINSPDFRSRGFRQVAAKRGRIGHPIPGVSVRIVDPETFVPRAPGEDGMLVVKGPNVMKGYLGRPDLTAEAIRDGWYLTGDIARMEEDGFITITDRLSRFSKIGGEMVPHIKVEEALHDALGASEQLLAVTAVEDEKKGERLVVLHTLPTERIEELVARLGGLGLPNLWLPRPESFHRVEAIPILGTGKMDLRKVKELALAFEEQVRID